MRRGRVWLLLSAGLIVQILALSMDPLRMYFDRGVPSFYTEVYPELRFDMNLSHLLQRPREIWEAVTAPPAPEFSPAAIPTAIAPFQVTLTREAMRAAGQRFQIYRGLRFWWASFPTLPPDQRPLPLGQTAMVFGIATGLGLGVLAIGLSFGDNLRPKPCVGASRLTASPGRESAG
jgi:hypothetical protein